MAGRRWDGKGYEATIKIVIDDNLAGALHRRYGTKRKSTERITVAITDEKDLWVGLFGKLQDEIESRDKADAMAKLADVPDDVLRAALAEREANGE